MSVHRPPSVTEQPFVEISQWNVFQFPNGDRHLVGYVGVEGRGRVTSKLMHWNATEKVLTTRSGRKYHLNGPPMYNHDAEYVWRVWCNFNGANPGEGDPVSFDYYDETSK